MESKAISHTQILFTVEFENQDAKIQKVFTVIDQLLHTNAPVNTMTTNFVLFHSLP